MSRVGLAAAGIETGRAAPQPPAPVRTSNDSMHTASRAIGDKKLSHLRSWSNHPNGQTGKSGWHIAVGASGSALGRSPVGAPGTKCKGLIYQGRPGLAASLLIAEACVLEPLRGFRDRT